MHARGGNLKRKCKIQGKLKEGERIEKLEQLQSLEKRKGTRERDC